MERAERGPGEEDRDELDDGWPEEGGEVVLTVHWDSGGPGAGAGANQVVKRGDGYWADFPDFGETLGPYGSLAEALARCSIGELTSACRAITYRQDEAGQKELLDALSPAEARLDIEINGETWRYRAGRWRRPRA